MVVRQFFHGQARFSYKLPKDIQQVLANFLGVAAQQAEEEGAQSEQRATGFTAESHSGFPVVVLMKLLISLQGNTNPLLP